VVREFESGSLMPIDDVYADDAFADTSLTVAYLWGVLITLAVILALQRWARHRTGTSVRPSRERLWSYAVMAVLWPLFIASIIFIVLWTVLTRRDR
jgi:uncharacterized iron-regulated membrane protein